MTGPERIAEYARTAREAVPDRKAAAALLRLAGRCAEDWTGPVGKAAFAEAIGRLVSLSDDRPVDFDTIQAVELAKRAAVAELRLDRAGWAMQLMDGGAMAAIHALVVASLLNWAGPSTRAMFVQKATDTAIPWQADSGQKGGSDA